MNDSKLLLCLVLLAAFPVNAGSLPDWVEAAQAAANDSPAPEDEQVWTLLDETRITLRKNGKWRKQRRVVRLVLRQRGGQAASTYQIDGQEDTTKIRKLKGWHRGVNDQVKKLNKQNVGTYGLSNLGTTSVDTATLAFFERVNKGDLVAFESEEELTTYMPMDSLMLLGRHPIHTRKISLLDESDGGTVILKPFGLEAWGLNAPHQGRHLVLKNLPALRHELFAPNAYLEYPWVLFGFSNQGADDPLADWDHLARWYAGVFRQKALGAGATARDAAADLATLQGVADHFRKKISYRQVYLSSARGYEPMSGAEVERRGYGDCKDMVSLLTWQSAKNRVAVAPALTNIVTDVYATESTPVHLGAFNHVIGAIPLSKSLGLPSEIEVKGKRYLLYDPTDRYTNLGYLGGQFRDRHIMICTDEGAAWAAVPPLALEVEAIEGGLVGQLDPDFTFQGQMTLVARGDAWGLRTIHNEANQPDLLGAIRNRLDIPAVVDLADAQISLSDDGVFKLQCRLLWPGFLRRNAGGFQLPDGVTGRVRRPLTEGRPRQQPIWVTAMTPTTWDLDLALPEPLAAQQDSFGWEEGLGRLKWQATSGKRLKVSFSLERRAAIYGLDQLEEGQAAWETYRRNYNRFLLEATLLYRRSAPDQPGQ